MTEVSGEPDVQAWTHAPVPEEAHDRIGADLLGR